MSDRSHYSSYTSYRTVVGDSRATSARPQTSDSQLALTGGGGSYMPDISRAPYPGETSTTRAPRPYRTTVTVTAPIMITHVMLRIAPEARPEAELLQPLTRDHGASDWDTHGRHATTQFSTDIDLAPGSYVVQLFLTDSSGDTRMCVAPNLEKVRLLLDGTRMNRLVRNERTSRFVQLTAFSFDERVSVRESQFMMPDRSASSACTSTSLRYSLASLRSAASQRTRAQLAGAAFVPEPPSAPESLRTAVRDGCRAHARTLTEMRARHRTFDSSYVSASESVEVDPELTKELAVVTVMQGLVHDSFAVLAELLQDPPAAWPIHCVLTLRNQSVALVLGGREASCWVFDSHGYYFGDGAEEGATLVRCENVDQLRRFLRERFAVTDSSQDDDPSARGASAAQPLKELSLQNQIAYEVTVVQLAGTAPMAKQKSSFAVVETRPAAVAATEDVVELEVSPSPSPSALTDNARSSDAAKPAVGDSAPLSEEPTFSKAEEVWELDDSDASSISLADAAAQAAGNYEGSLASWRRDAVGGPSAPSGPPRELPGSGAGPAPGPGSETNPYPAAPHRVPEFGQQEPVLGAALPPQAGLDAAEALAGQADPTLPFRLARLGDLAAVRAIYAAEPGAITSVKHPDTGASLLQYCVLLGDVDLALFLLEAGCDPRNKDRRGRDAMTAAREYGSELMEELILGGFDRIVVDEAKESRRLQREQAARHQVESSLRPLTAAERLAQYETEYNAGIGLRATTATGAVVAPPAPAPGSFFRDSSAIRSADIVAPPSPIGAAPPSKYNPTNYAAGSSAAAAAGTGASRAAASASASAAPSQARRESTEYYCYKCSSCVARLDPGVQASHTLIEVIRGSNRLAHRALQLTPTALDPGTRTTSSSTLFYKDLSPTATYVQEMVGDCLRCPSCKGLVGVLGLTGSRAFLLLDRCGMNGAGTAAAAPEPSSRTVGRSGDGRSGSSSLAPGAAAAAAAATYPPPSSDPYFEARLQAALRGQNTTYYTTYTATGGNIYMPSTGAASQLLGSSARAPQHSSSDYTYSSTTTTSQSGAAGLGGLGGSSATPSSPAAAARLGSRGAGQSYRPATAADVYRGSGSAATRPW